MIRCLGIRINNKENNIPMRMRRKGMIMRGKDIFLLLEPVQTIYPEIIDPKLLRKKSIHISNITDSFEIRSISIWGCFPLINSNRNSIEKNPLLQTLKISSSLMERPSYQKIMPKLRILLNSRPIQTKIAKMLSMSSSRRTSRSNL